MAFGVDPGNKLIRSINRLYREDFMSDTPRTDMKNESRSEARAKVTVGWRGWLESFGDQSLVGIKASAALAHIQALERELAEANRRLSDGVAREEALRDALDDMVKQFAYTGNGKRTTGGLSALERAFDVLGLDDPHPLTKDEMCDEPGCNAEISCGTPTPSGYRRTCSLHYPGRKALATPEGVALGCQCDFCKIRPHSSDCAVHSMPAYPITPCTCGAYARLESSQNSPEAK